MVEQQLQNFGKPLGTNSLCERGKFRRSWAESVIFRRFVRANKELHERAKGGGNEVGNRETSLEVVPFPPPEIRPLILVPRLPCAVSLKQRQISLEASCAEEIRIEISTVSGQFYGFPFFKSKPTLWYKFLKSFVRGRIFSGGNSFERWFDRRISFFSRFVGIFFCFFSR